MKIFSLILSLLFVLFTGCGKSSSLKREVKYPKLTPEILKSIPDTELESAVIDYIYSKIGNDYENDFKIVTSLPKEFQTIYATWWVEAEVNNGGFNQYFWNSAGQFSNQALEGYKLLNANSHAELMAEAIKIHREQEPKLKKFKEKDTMEAFSESYKDNPLNKCDDKFDKLTEDAGALRIKFIREHPELFVGS